MTSLTTALPAGTLRIGRWVITLALLALLWQAADGQDILRALAGANRALLATAVAVLMVQTLLSALRWRLTAAELGQKLPMPRAIREYFLSQAVNQALPGGVMGDAARAVRARSEVGLMVSGLAVGLERLAGQIAMFVLLACAFTVTLVVPGGLDWPPHYAAPVGGVVGAVTLAMLGVALFLGPLGLNDAGSTAWLGRAFRALAGPRVLPAQIGLGVAITLCNVAAFGFCAWAVGLPLSWGALLALVPLILFSMIIPLTVSGWGIREGSAALLLPLAGAAVPDAVAASVLFGLAMLVAATPGLFMALSR